MTSLQPALDHFNRLDPSGGEARWFVDQWNQATRHPRAVLLLDPPVIGLGWWLPTEANAPPMFFVRFVFGPGAMPRILERFEQDARARGIDPDTVRILYGRSRWGSVPARFKPFSYSTIKRHFRHVQRAA